MLMLMKAASSDWTATSYELFFCLDTGDNEDDSGDDEDEDDDD